LKLKKKLLTSVTYHQGEIVSIEYLDDLEAQINAYEEMNADRFVLQVKIWNYLSNGGKTR
jgi:hypothetical protein